METTTQTTESFDPRPKSLPGMLNVLTILTIIGCVFYYLSAIWGFFSAGMYREQMAEMENMDMEDSPMGGLLKGSVEMMEKTYEYRYILLVSGLLFTTLCLIGALQMRKLKKSGYLLYVIGELAPILVSAFIMGFSILGGFGIIMGAAIPVLFVILYTTQRKYLVN